MKSDTNLSRIITTIKVFASVSVHTPFCFPRKVRPEKKSLRFVVFTVDTVSFRLDAWNQFGFKGLEDNAGSGRPKILSAAEEEKVFEIAMRNPRFPARELEAITTEVGKKISVWTLKGVLKKKTTFGKESS